MDFKVLAYKLGYPVIFCASPEAASANLFRLITKRQGGYDEGAERWHAEISHVLDGEYNLKELSKCGSRLTEDEWHQTLRTLRDELSSFLEQEAT